MGDGGWGMGEAGSGKRDNKKPEVAIYARPRVRYCRTQSRASRFPHPPSRSRPLLRQFLAGDRVDRAAIRPAFELRENLTHDRADLRRSARDRRFHGGAELFVTDLSGKIFLQRGCFRRFLVGEVVAVSLLVKVHRLATLLDRLSQNVNDIRISRIASQLDLFVLDLGEDGAKEQRTGLVLGFASGI